MSVNRETLKSLHLDHETVPRPAKNLRLLGYLAAITALLAAIAVVLWLVIGQRAVAVQTAAATAVGNGAGSSPALVLNAFGYVVAEQQATVSSQVTGLIKEVLVDEGMQVQAGQQRMARREEQRGDICWENGGCDHRRDVCSGGALGLCGEISGGPQI